MNTRFLQTCFMETFEIVATYRPIILDRTLTLLCLNLMACLLTISLMLWMIIS